ncbi:ABC transporter ATP-binding protein [Verrucomicrobiota bacterium]
MIALNNVTMRYAVPKRYREYLLHPLRQSGIVALRDANANFERGDCVGFLGANGAGKTTILKLIGGLLYPSVGEVIVNGYDTVKHNLKARQSVGYVLNEERSFYWRLTGIQNLTFFGTLDNLFGNRLKKRISDMLGLVGLGDAGDKRVSNYSTGMRQRLAIARGLLADPDVLLLDEPTKSVDPVAADELRSLIKDIHSTGKKTLIIATHNIAEAEALCDKVLILKKGRIIADKDMEQMQGALAKFYRESLAEDAKTTEDR